MNLTLFASLAFAHLVAVVSPEKQRQPSGQMQGLQKELNS